MSKHLLVGFTLLLAFFNYACRSRQEAKSSTTNDSTQTAPATSSVAVSPRLDSLGLTTDSHWRGINLGDPITTVKAKEKAELFESDDKHVGYTVEFENLESTDILYYQTDQKVSAIEADIFLNNRQSVDGYQSDLQIYFKARYGNPITESGATIWTGPKDERISLKDVSKGKDYGLKIKISPVKAPTTASVK